VISFLRLGLFSDVAALPEAGASLAIGVLTGELEGCSRADASLLHVGCLSDESPGSGVAALAFFFFEGVSSISSDLRLLRRGGGGSLGLR
jgi:hypothetical protein